MAMGQNTLIGNNSLNKRPPEPTLEIEDTFSQKPEQTEARKSRRGGARKNAGRKPLYGEAKTKQYEIRLPLETIAALDAIAKAKGIRKSTLIHEAIRRIILENV